MGKASELNRRGNSLPTGFGEAEGYEGLSPPRPKAPRDERGGIEEGLRKDCTLHRRSLNIFRAGRITNKENKGIWKEKLNRNSTFKRELSKDYPPMRKNTGKQFEGRKLWGESGLNLEKKY